MPIPQDRYPAAKILEVAGRIEVRGTPATAQAFIDVSHALIAYLDRWEELGGSFAQRPADDVRQQLYELRDAVAAARQELGNHIRVDLGHA